MTLRPQNLWLLGVTRLRVSSNCGHFHKDKAMTDRSKDIFTSEFRKDIARQSHIGYIEYMWQEKAKFSKGFHTEKISNKIDDALLRFKRGEEVYLKINVPFRHGKSTIVKYLMSRVCGMAPECEILYGTHTAKLAEMVSKDVRRHCGSAKFKALFPSVQVNPNSKAVDRWELVVKENNKLVNKGGAFNITSIGSGTAGIGSEILVLDDIFANRKSAESQTQRDDAWNFFTNDFLSRANPPQNGRGTLVIVLGTPWHIDDVFGRIERCMVEDPSFPQFEALCYPAKAIDYEGEDEYPGEYLFSKIRVFEDGVPKVIDGHIQPSWYAARYSALGRYDASSLLDCRPISRGGGLIETEKIRWYDGTDEFPTSGLLRVWDLAHSEGVAKNGKKSKADWTGGTLLSFKRGNKIEGTNQYFYDLYVYDYRQIKASSPKRDAFIKRTMQEDGSKVVQVIEQSLDNVDTVNNLISAMTGKYRVKGQKYKGSKASRIEPVLPLFEGGRVHAYKFAEKEEWLKQLSSFTADESGAAHDECVDNISCGWKYYEEKKANGYSHSATISLG